MTVTMITLITTCVSAYAAIQVILWKGFIAVSKKLINGVSEKRAKRKAKKNKK